MKARALSLLALLVLAGCPVDDGGTFVYAGRRWVHTIDGATGTFEDDPNDPPIQVPITNQGFPVVAGACLCPSEDSVFMSYVDGLIEFNQAVANIDAKIDDAAIAVCESRAENVFGMDDNNCAEMVEAISEDPERQGVCSIITQGPCAPDFGTDTGAGDDEIGTEEGDAPDMMDGGSDTGDESDTGPVVPAARAQHNNSTRNGPKSKSASYRGSKG